MALTQGARNKIKSFVQEVKKILFKEFKSQLLGNYGFNEDGTYIYEEELTTQDANVKEVAILLRKRYEYLKSGIAGNNKEVEAFEQLIREQAFTILNRFAALRLSEERGIIRPSINEGYNSKGFQVYDQLTGGSQAGDQFQRYRWYLNAVFDELAVDLPSIFDRYSPYVLMFPSESVLLDILSVINDHELAIYREEGVQPINLWKADETIGWIYQYYNSREEISAMRDASGAPRNSRELAVRNQFFTPRYVVQFLTDNSLGQQWYEMCRGKTDLPDACEYMVKHKQIVFLDEGIDPPKDREDEIHYVQYRPIKDPRDILMLDPACGSMHFGLYCFDLYEIIYKEAWDNHPSLIQDLRAQWTREEFVKQIPSLIIRYNIHGVDIDPRAIQIAGLSLWLRAQRYYDELGLQPKDRPNISKSNLVVAEPFPGDPKMFSEFSQSLPGPLGKLLRVIWDKIKLAGETGMLLKIEEELKKEIEIARQEWEQYKNESAQSEMFAPPEQSKAAEMAAVYGKGQKITKDFFDTAEEQVLVELKSFAENAQGENTFQKLLFAEDTARGFAFIDLCRKRYDVILMNPPFGASSENTKIYIGSEFPLSKSDLASVFIDRMLQLLKSQGNLGSITTRTIFFLGTYTKWRSNQLINNNFIQYFADLGGEVLDAMVEVASYIIKKGTSNHLSEFYRVTKENDKAPYLKKIIELNNKDIYRISPNSFNVVGNEPICYWIDPKTLELFRNIKSSYYESFAGLQTSDNFRFVRNIWELNRNTNPIFLLGDGSSRFYYNYNATLSWHCNGKEIRNFKKSVIRNECHYYKPLITWSKRSEKFQPHFVFGGTIASVSRYFIPLNNLNEIDLLSILNTNYFDYLFKLCVEKDFQPVYINGTFNNLPISKISNELTEKINGISQTLYFSVKECYSSDDKCISFNNSEFTLCKSLKNFTRQLSHKLFKKKIGYLANLKSLNNIVYTYYGITEDKRSDIEEITSKAGESIEGKVFDKNESDIYRQIFQILVGCVFGRFDLRLLKHWNVEWSDEDIFKVRKHSPFLKGPKESTLDLVLPEFHAEIKKIWDIKYPIKILDETASIDQVQDKLEEILQYFWEENAGTIISELEEHYKVSDLSELFVKHNQFFDTHIKDYSRNKRISPIYWHLAIPSGKFVLWVYYPDLTDQSLYKANKLVENRIEEVKYEIDQLIIGGSSTALSEQKELLTELESFKEEILRVAKFYKPNQDDGVLITAAPLHNLFRHTKWKKATEACWKKLEKGEYDWAHLAYSIWPDRVRNKCKKDLSMAIAHGLEDICEIKPKEKKKRKKKGVDIQKQQKLL